MKFDNSLIRRQDRVLAEDLAMDLLMNGEYGFLSMVSTENSGYGIPLNYVLKNDLLYFHCALDGDKVKFLEVNNSVSFCVVGKTQVISNKFTTAYESVLLKGKVVLEISDAEKMLALELIIDKYSPNDKILGMKYAKNSFTRTRIFKLEIESISAKAKVLK